MISGLYQTAEPQDALWHFGGQCAARDCQNCQNCQICQKICKAQNVQKQHFQGLANKGVCQCVVPASSGLFRPRGIAQPCPAFPSLLQLTPARPGPRSLAQLPRGPGTVPIVQGASQRSYRAQEPWQCPGMCPGGAHGHIHLQPIGTVPRLKNSVWKHLEKL